MTWDQAEKDAYYSAFWAEMSEEEKWGRQDEQEKFWKEWDENTARWDLMPNSGYNVCPQDTFQKILKSYFVPETRMYRTPNYSDVIDDEGEFWKALELHYPNVAEVISVNEKQKIVLRNHTLIDPIGGFHFLLPLKVIDVPPLF